MLLYQAFVAVSWSFFACFVLRSSRLKEVKKGHFFDASGGGIGEKGAFCL